MPCLALIFGLAFPRVVLVYLFLFTNFISRAFQGLLLPLLGFFFVPLTTLIYAAVVNSGAQITGIYLALIVIGVVVDLGLIGHGATRRA